MNLQDALGRSCIYIWIHTSRRDIAGTHIRGDILFYADIVLGDTLCPRGGGVEEQQS